MPHLPYLPFDLTGRGTTVARELRGAAATFLTISISHGVGYGFITFVAIKLLTGRAADVHPLMHATAAAFAAYFIAF